VPAENFCQNEEKISLLLKTFAEARNSFHLSKIFRALVKNCPPHASEQNPQPRGQIFSDKNKTTVAS